MHSRKIEWVALDKEKGFVKGIAFEKTPLPVASEGRKEHAF
jgi:hypothetical protein